MGFLFGTDLVNIVSDHPLIAAWLGLFLVLIVALGSMHVSRICGNFLVEVVREFKHEFLGIGKVVRRLRRELTTWKLDE
jgi:hypothetical protein